MNIQRQFSTEDAKPNDLDERLRAVVALLESIIAEARSDPTWVQTLSVQAPFSIQRYVRLRRLRERIFPQDLFRDPAWDILLDLRIAELANRKPSISAVCHASAAPPSTALRYINQLIQLGLVTRLDNPADKRAGELVLSPIGSATMAAWEREAIFSGHVPNEAHEGPGGNRHGSPTS